MSGIEPKKAPSTNNVTSPSDASANDGKNGTISSAGRQPLANYMPHMNYHPGYHHMHPSYFASQNMGMPHAGMAPGMNPAYPPHPHSLGQHPYPHPAAYGMHMQMGMHPNIMYPPPHVSSIPAPPSCAPVSVPSSNRSERDNNNNKEMHQITFHPPGFPHPFDVPFPERRLPVCERCKKNYKSRDLCRTRDGHKSLPWTTTYIAITIDDSLFEKDPDTGSLKYANVPIEAELKDVPLMCLGPADGSMIKEPICKVCREKNYTRDYCRTTCRHTTPPWNCTYVKIRAGSVMTADGKGGNGEGQQPKKRRRAGQPYEDGSLRNSGKKRKNSKKKDGVTEEEEEQNIEQDSLEAHAAEDEEKSDDLTEVHESRTFLAAVSTKSVVVRWCEEIRYPPESGGQQIPPSVEQYFNMHQHSSSTTKVKKSSPDDEEDEKEEEGSSKKNKNDISIKNDPMASITNMMNKSNSAFQNNQLWEAFRAGAMWAQSQAAQAQYPGSFGYGGMPSNPMAFFSQSQGMERMQEEMRFVGAVGMGADKGVGRDAEASIGQEGDDSKRASFHNKNPEFGKGTQDDGEGNNECGDNAGDGENGEV